MRLLASPVPPRPAFRSGFTLVELMVASAIGIFLVGGVMSFSKFALVAFSGITSQSMINQQGGFAIELIQERVRKATSMSNGVAGNTLTLGFDNNYTVDSDGDEKPYNDQDRYERFQFIGVNATNSASCLSNRLVYFPDITKTNQRVLVKSGLRNLPGFKIFQVTNDNTAIIRFGIADAYAGDHYQSIDIQGSAVTLNRPVTGTNFILINF